MLNLRACRDRVPRSEVHWMRKRRGRPAPDRGRLAAAPRSAVWRPFGAAVALNWSVRSVRRTKASRKGQAHSTACARQPGAAQFFVLTRNVLIRPC